MPAAVPPPPLTFGLTIFPSKLCVKKKDKCRYFLPPTLTSHVHVHQQCIVRGLGFGLENKERSKEDQRHY